MQLLLFIQFLLLTIIFCHFSNSIEFESEDLVRWARDAHKDKAPTKGGGGSDDGDCVDPNSLLKIGTFRSEEKEVFILEGKCFDECRQRFTQPAGQNGSTFWQRLKGLFDRVQGGTPEEKKDRLKAACFLKCFCQQPQ